MKANVKPLFAARAYKSLVELKSAITNYKQVCEESRETTYDLPMQWGNKEGSQEHYKQRDNRLKAAAAGQGRKLDHTGFAIAATGDATWHRRN
ncbi:hypothetical protein EVAR_64110_1 [Eumeta japonica]|uniref:Uncharacterized protein n=1 Tax=Eumeta variegata TaxID=151549 RepID=A0A4C1ZDX3_EUMVA|nr:hypothetical protein EVAR_64110_1 [Eumeta japonica]